MTTETRNTDSNETSEARHRSQEARNEARIIAMRVVASVEAESSSKSTRPQAAVTDPLFEARQAANCYGDVISQREVIQAWTFLEGLDEQRGGWSREGDGPMVARHRNFGFRVSADRAKHLFIAGYYKGENALFSDLQPGLSDSGAEHRVVSILYYLHQAITSGIWHEDGVAESA